MKNEDKKTPMLDPKIKNEQDIKKPRKSGDPNSEPKKTDEPVKKDPEKIPESNDPAGYGDKGNVKKSPFKK